jgi:hypothetical protein
MAQARDRREITSETGDGWQHLGFYHEPDHERRLWRKAGLIRLKFKRANRELGEALAGMLEEALAHVRERL